MTRRRVLLGICVLFVVAIGTIGTVLWIGRERPPERSATALCEQLAETYGLDAAIVSLDPTRLGPLVAALERAVTVAPDDIVGPLTTLTTFVRDVADDVRSEAVDKRSALTAALAARQDRIDAVSAAGQTVERWNADNCGTSLRSTTTTAPRTTTTRR